MVEFSVLHVPIERRVQTTFVFGFLLFVLCCLIIWGCCILNPLLWFIYIPYILFAKYVDKAHQTGGRPFRVVIFSRFWKVFAAYFPASIKFQDDWNLDADEKDRYLFSLHPHGIAGLGVWANVLSNGGGLHSLLPGLNLRVVTLPVNFFVPLWREFIISLGLIDSNESSILAACQQNCSIGIVVGGAAEALDAVPNKDYVLTLKRRRGFIRIAMRRGMPLVPVFSYGENDLFFQATHPLLRRIQNIAKKYLGFSTPLFIGRGVFNYTFGLLPHRKRIVTVFGKPIPVEQCDSPTMEQLEEMHHKYIEELKKLYYQYRDEYDLERELIFE